MVCWLLYRHTCCYYQLHITSSLLIVTMEKDESKSIFNDKNIHFYIKLMPELLFTVRDGCTRLSRGVRGGGMVVLLGGHTYPESVLLLSMSSEEDEEV